MVTRLDPLRYQGAIVFERELEWHESTGSGYQVPATAGLRWERTTQDR
jgi:hypothetical protein